MSESILVVIADDHPIVRKGLREIIEEEPDMRVAGEAADGEACLALIEKLRPDIVVLDVNMPKVNGFSLAEELHKRKLAVDIIFLTVHDDVDLLQRAMDLGKGYILKESGLIEIVNGIRSVAAGKPYVSPTMTASLLSRRSQAQAFERDMPALASLTPAERRILSLIAAGKPTKVIAAELHVHPRTIETHRASICQKLHLNGANSLLRFALENKSKLLG
jgi:DNA-binding NarL/FixJ family response regulator